MTTARKRRLTPEGGVLRACLDLLAAERIWHRRWNTGAVKLGNRFFRFGKPGDADILALPYMKRPIERPLIEVRPLWIECKATKGKQTPDQRAFQWEVEAEGHIYLLIRDVSELQKFLSDGK